jgi:ribosomal protein L37AE/L43A
MKLTPYEKVKQWRKDNPEKFKEQYKRRYLNNAEAIKERKRIKYHEDKNHERHTPQEYSDYIWRCTKCGEIVNIDDGDFGFCKSKVNCSIK